MTTAGMMAPDRQRSHATDSPVGTRHRQEDGEGGDDHAEKNPVVHTGEHLEGQPQAGPQTGADRPAVERTMDPPHRQRHPDGPLQLEVHEMLDPIGHEREDGGRHQRRVEVAGQMPDQDEHADAGRHDAGEQEDVVDGDGIDMRPEPRRGEQTLEKCRVGKGKRARDSGRRCCRRIDASGRPPSARGRATTASRCSAADRGRGRRRSRGAAPAARSA